MSESEYDYDFILNFNKDLQKRFNNNKKIIINYLKKNGKKENRIFDNDHKFYFKNYNWTKYLNNNKDLKKGNINDEKKAYMHYIFYGMREKRDIYILDNIDNTIIYNHLKSKLDSEDILKDNINKKNNNKQIINDDEDNINNNKIINDDEDNNQIENNIKNNNKIINNDENNNNQIINDNKKNKNNDQNLEMIYYMYDWDRYLEENPDLINNGIDTNIDAYNHYMKYGKKEGRNIVPKVNLRINEIYHEDDNYISDEENNNFILKKYNLDIDNKIYNIDNDFYCNINKDLLKNINIDNKINILNHFLNIGLEKNLPYSKYHYYLYINYNWNKYLNNLKNKNIILNNSDDAYKYYIKLFENNKHNYEIIDYDFEINKLSKEFFSEFYNINYNISDDNFLRLFLLNDDNKKKICTYSNYFIYKIINWDEFKNNNIINKNINNNIDLLMYYIKNIKNIKINFNLSLNILLLDNIINNKNISLFFQNLKDFKNNIKKSIINQNYIFINNLININNFLIKINKNYNFN